MHRKKRHWNKEASKKKRGIRNDLKNNLKALSICPLERVNEIYDYIEEQYKTNDSKESSDV